VSIAAVMVMRAVFHSTFWPVRIMIEPMMVPMNSGSNRIIRLEG